MKNIELFGDEIKELIRESLRITYTIVKDDFDKVYELFEIKRELENKNKLLSTFTEAENRKALMKKVTKGYTDMLLYKVINSSIFESIKLDEMQTKDAKDVIENLLNGACEWFSIDMAIKKLEELGIEFLDERD